jgi:mono/diheme cytochrome c family protein
MLYVVLALFILLGLGVFFVAMGGGPRGARAALHTEGGSGQHVVTLGVIVLFAFGLAVPAIVLAFNAEHKASVAAGGVHLNNNEQKGRELFARACAVCHTLAAVKSVGQIGPNLDKRVGDAIAGKTAAEHMTLAKGLVLDAIEKGRARGLGQMPALLYQGREVEDVADFVAAVAGH